ncbi:MULTISPECIES: hypothetical protein [Moorena]|uniref:hypothetical protein n=1 Tax=Moorena TaxID=1155738 RepID=UPI0002D9693C|nr:MULTISPECIES: hypothetical protein [Moorena]NEP36620.1 hypothetical protein [Moorena sp. SIO3B2]NEQ16587.1 hypothetical protein [Moorena sp. SIO3E2]NER85520.1 hypothetical protein [Moorena sp. SIO3A2]
MRSRHSAIASFFSECCAWKGNFLGIHIVALLSITIDEITCQKLEMLFSLKNK